MSTRKTTIVNIQERKPKRGGDDPPLPNTFFLTGVRLIKQKHILKIKEVCSKLQARRFPIVLSDLEGVDKEIIRHLGVHKYKRVEVWKSVSNDSGYMTAHGQNFYVPYGPEQRDAVLVNRSKAVLIIGKPNARLRKIISFAKGLNKEVRIYV